MGDACQSGREFSGLKGAVMKRIINKIISITMVILMIIPLTCQVFADDIVPEDPETVPAVEGVQPESETPAAPEEPEAPEPAGSEENPPAVSEADEPEAVETPAASGEEIQPELKKAPAAAGQTVSEGTSSTSKKNITISGTILDCSENGSGDGWTYEKDSGRVVLRDYKASGDITSDGTGVDIVSTGFNRIGTLSCDGDINVIGAGILLIDKVELASGCSFNLLPLKEYYGEDGGSVAVFILQDDGSYKYANGSIKGVVDENVELPEDVRLVMPATTLLELQAYKVIVEKDINGNETIIRDFKGYSEEELAAAEYRYYRGHLITNDLTVEEGATIRNAELKDEIAASIIVGGNLVNNGVISGGSATVCGSYSGTGSVENSFITLRQEQAVSMDMKDSVLSLEWGDYSIEALNVTGGCEVHYDGDLVVNNIKSSEKGSVAIYNMRTIDNSSTCRLTGKIDGTAVSVRSGITELGEQLELLNGGSVSNDTYGGPVFNYSGINKVSYGTNGSVFLAPGNITVPQRNSVPAVAFTLVQTLETRGNIVLQETPDLYTELANYDASGITYITYNDLLSTYCPNGAPPDPDLLGSPGIVFEVFCCNADSISMTVLDETGEQADPAGVFLIRMANYNYWKDSTGGSTLTTTRADQTGSGNIGGNSSLVFTGTGITRPSSEDAAEPSPDPVKPADPDPAKPDDNKTVKPVKEYSASAVTAAGDTLVIQVNMFDLNADNDENAGKAPFYNLTAYINGVQVSELSGTVTVEMEYVLPEDFRDKPLYAVFVNEDETSDETFAAVRAEYDEEKRILTFETSQLGEFTITAFEFDGKEFSPEFYDELEKTDAVKLFAEHLKEKKDNAGL